MSRRLLALIAVCLSLFLLGACQKEAPKEPEITAPTSASDTAGWKKYLTVLIKTYLPTDKNSRAYTIFAEANQDAEKTTRQIESTRNFLARGVAEGTMLVLVSPDSALIANVVEQSFAEPQADKLTGSKVLYIGSAAELERVRAAVTPWGPEFVFHELK